MQPDNIPGYVTPLLVLVNVKSGGQQGQELIRAYRKCVNPLQVFDLMQGGPLPGYVKKMLIANNIFENVNSIFPILKINKEFI